MKYSSTGMALILFLLFTGPLHAETFSGKLVGAPTGDTIEVEDAGSLQEVRLAQIHAPIEDQPFGMIARNFILKKAAGQSVTVRFDAYNLLSQPIGEVFLPDGRSLNKLIVEAGYAWRYDGFSDDPDYGEKEQAARDAGSGLWAGDNPVPPWEWKWIQRQVRRSTSASQTSASAFSCGSKQYCHEMSSCLEAKFYLYACGLTRLDRNGNGIPCDAKCE